MAFFQDPPRLGNQFDDDELLGEYLERTLGREGLAAARDELRFLGELGGRHLYELQLRDRLNEPRHTPWDAWGRRVDEVEVSPLWREAAALSAEHGLVAAGYDRELGEHARVHQFARNYLVQASLDVYSCPLAMTDGAAATLLALGNRELVERAVPRLTSRDPRVMWTSGQWMTERTGGSDVSLSETEARQSPDGWRLYGTKWFTSAITCDMALTLARPEGNEPGSRGLALFYVEIRDGEGKLNGLQINRLKDKLGTRKVPTAELALDGASAVPVAGLRDGVRNITPMLTITRAWNAFGAVGFMRRAIALAKDYAARRAQFGGLLADKPLHRDTIAGLQAELEGALLLAFRVAELLGRQEAGAASEVEQTLLRVLTPVAKLVTAKQSVAVTSEGIECFGGAGYVEDTGLPAILRDAQVLPIWEGTTNVLSLDTLRALGKEGSAEAFAAEIRECLAAVRDDSLAEAAAGVRAALDHALSWLAASKHDPPRLEAGARRLAMTLGRTLEVALLARHAQWCLDGGRGGRAAAATRRLHMHGVDTIRDAEEDDAALLAR